jgi:uncharacterized protein YndB with AHSA1/START domain
MNSSLVADASPIQFDRSCELDVAPEKLFALLRDYEALPQWVPGLSRVEVDRSWAQSPDGVGTRRTLHPKLGVAGVETITAFEPPRLLAYSASDESLRGLYTAHSSELLCIPTERGTCLRWTIRAQPSAIWWKRVATRVMFGMAQQASLHRLHERFGNVSR